MKDEDSCQVLIIDDEKDLCYLLQTIFKEKGLSTLIANNLKEATIKLRNKPTLIFLDHNLPDGSGLEFIHIIREYTKNTFVVMMTAQSSESFAKQVYQSGINYYLVKPFDLSSVTSLIDKIAC